MSKHQVYRFSPVESKEALLEAVNYVTRQATKMIFGIQGYTLSIKYATIFAHYEEEYDKLVEILAGLGDQQDANNGAFVTLKEPLSARGMTLDVNGKIEEVSHQIKQIWIRRPDPHRTQVGCADYEMDLESYKWMTNAELCSGNSLRLIERPDKEMVEVSDPDYDVLGYIVRPTKKA